MDPVVVVLTLEEIVAKHISKGGMKKPKDKKPVKMGKMGKRAKLPETFTKMKK